MIHTVGGDGLGWRPTVVGGRHTMVAGRPTTNLRFIVLRGSTCLHAKTAAVWSHAVVGRRPTTDLLHVLVCMHGL